LTDQARLSPIWTTLDRGLAIRFSILTVLLVAVLTPAAAARAVVGYRVPPDNPFVSTPGARGEIYVYGLRNPWRWSFDPRNGAMIIGDVGGGQREEITYLPPGSIRGANLGWNCLEGTRVLEGCRPRNYFPPTHQYRSNPDVVIGGYVVRDPTLPSFAGRYLYGRYNGGIYALGPRASGRAVNTGVRLDGLTSFGEDVAGHLYATTHNGPVYRLGERAGTLRLTRIGVFNRPVGLAAVPGDTTAVFIVEKRGVVKLRTGGVVSDFLDISGLVRDVAYEEGLLGFAAAPDYAASGRVFAYYTNNDGDLQLDEYARAARGPDRSAAGTRRPLLTIRHRSIYHHGGQLLFGADGYLYLSTGDGDGRGDPNGDAQSLGSLLGKILRLDVGTAVPRPPDTVAPALRARVKEAQRVLQLGAAVAYVRCSESCSVVADGRLWIAGREYHLGRSARVAGPGTPVRVRVRLPAETRRALRRARRAPRLRLHLQARDAAGNSSSDLVREVRVRR
jgi:glucose/arabinose dehydrogenase